MNETLQELILRFKEENELSYEAIAIKCGGLLTRQQVQQLASRQPKAFPDVDTIRGLARGLGVPIVEIIHASSRSLGLPVGSTAPDTLFVYGSSSWPATMRDTYAEMGRQLSMALEQGLTGGVQGGSDDDQYI